MDLRFQLGSKGPLSLYVGRKKLLTVRIPKGRHKWLVDLHERKYNCEFTNVRMRRVGGENRVIGKDVLARHQGMDM